MARSRSRHLRQSHRDFTWQHRLGGCGHRRRVRGARMTQPRLEGRVAIVSGGARGIGEAHVRALAGEGAHVVIGDVLTDEGAALAKELGERVRSVMLDVTSESDWTAAVIA